MTIQLFAFLFGFYSPHESTAGQTRGCWLEAKQSKTISQIIIMRCYCFVYSLVYFVNDI